MPHQCTECGYTFPDGSKEMLSGCPDCGGNKFQYHPGAVPDDAEGGTEESPPDRPDPGVSGAVGRAADTVRDVFGSGEDTADARPERGEPTAADADARSAADDTSPRSAADDAAADPTANADSGAGDDLTADADDADPVTIEEASSAEPAPESPDETRGDREDPAQADARRQVVDESDLPSPDEVADREGTESRPSDTPDTEPSDDASDIPSDSGGADTPPKPGADDDERPELSELREELNSQFESIRIVEPGQYELNLMELYDRDQYIIALQEDGRYVIEVPEAWRDE